ncbi:2-hydroxychromene-2-carboxylate isomerase [Variovorax sp. KK3]|uniref:2-hydroxychromene-2-carboxylate isomerase n=1 Tax=Variovorax sp. KK3 TaxID=1855728 RepID=UPI00097CBF94|nr:2-hydroxychromene-2-carboxylate isomerase [Variovorax sp. KK3]
MKQIVFHLDFISPYAYLAFEHLPRALEGLSYGVAYRPVLLGALLKQHGQLGPAEIPAKRAWTYRHVLWLGQAHDIAIEMPATHPYNPLPHLRVALAASSDGDISRHVAETVFRQVWQGGAEAGDATRLADLASGLPLRRDAAGDEVKAQLKANTEAAIAAGVFGVPAFEVDGRMFWGFDGLAMLGAYLRNDRWFAESHWDAAPARPSLLRSSKS